MRIRTIIVDGEYINREVVSILIKNIDRNFEIIGKAKNIKEAHHLIVECKPDLVLLDVKMPDGNGFELLQQFENPDFEVVFITGFHEHALQAFNFNALDYILKPIDTEKLKNTLKKVYTRINLKTSIREDLKEALALYSVDSKLITRIPIHLHDKVELIDVTDILSVKADHGCTIFKTINNVEFISSNQFSSFEFIIEKFSNFIKINKGIYININCIRNYSKGIACNITLKNNEIYEVSRRKKAEILTLLELKA